MRYTVVLDPNPGSGVYTVTVPALPGCVTEGATFEEALANAHEAIEGFVETLVLLGEAVPREDPGLAVVSVEIADRVDQAEVAALT
jgi:predicted RNase H-like HicB family nuclease